MNLREVIKQIEELGYNNEDSVARVCQDIVLKGIAQSALSRNVTIKGGVEKSDRKYPQGHSGYGYRFYQVFVG